MNEKNQILAIKNILNWPCQNFFTTIQTKTSFWQLRFFNRITDVATFNDISTTADNMPAQQLYTPAHKTVRYNLESYDNGHTLHFEDN